MAPAGLQPSAILHDLTRELHTFRRMRIPIRHVVVFSILWVAQRVTYWWGWHSVSAPGMGSPS
jgi:hypothetical protein